MTTSELTQEITLTRESILRDFRLMCESRNISLIGRKEVFMGKAKFGIFGDGKELAQIAMAKVFKKGDFRSGYYRDQTFMFAIGELTYEQFFAQLYAHTDLLADPASAGRMMNSHFGTHLLHEDGSWRDMAQLKNSVSDISPTAAQIPRLVGLGYASKLFRQNPALHKFTQFSTQGNEIAFGTIGNASTSEGIFFESINAAGVLQIPVLISVWDDEYGISVPQKYHTTKESISKALAGFQRNEDEPGWEIMEVKAWDYPALLETYQKAAKICREEHVPVLVHVTEVTQQQGHSTSGSHERYKSKERLEWEKEYDCLKKMKDWMISEGLASLEVLEDIENEAKVTANKAKAQAWRSYGLALQQDYVEALELIKEASLQSKKQADLQALYSDLDKTIDPIKSDSIRAIKKALRILRHENLPVKTALLNWLNLVTEKNRQDYNSHLYSETKASPLLIPEIKPVYDEINPKWVDGREVLQACFDALLENNPLFFAIGEDVGKIGDVNQAFAGLQEKYGELRVTDTGIREATILGQGLGAALRGLRPIAEIQYLDYIYYAIQGMADDLSCLYYRTKGRQKAPLIIRTRGHRLEGIWHTGSPIGMLLGSIRGIYLLVPRDMTKAAGFYNTLMQGDNPALVIECLNGYRLKERLPLNVGEFTTPLGVVEVLKEGKDLTLVTYGSMCRIVMDAAKQLEEVGIQCEVIDVQSLLPFDLNHDILKSIQKTNRVIFADEDVSGGGSAYMMQKVLEEQGAYRWLDSPPLTISAQDHRPAYGSDGDYFSKPNAEDIFDNVYRMMREANPAKFPDIY